MAANTPCASAAPKMHRLPADHVRFAISKQVGRTLAKRTKAARSRIANASPKKDEKRREDRGVRSIQTRKATSGAQSNHILVRSFCKFLTRPSIDDHHGTSTANSHTANSQQRASCNQTGASGNPAVAIAMDGPSQLPPKLSIKPKGDRQHGAQQNKGDHQCHQTGHTTRRPLTKRDPAATMASSTWKPKWQPRPMKSPKGQHINAPYAQQGQRQSGQKYDQHGDVSIDPNIQFH